MNNLFYRGSKESWNGQNQAEFSDSLVFITDENSREFYTGGKDYQCLTTPEKESVTALIEASAEFITKTEHEKTEQVISASLNDLNSRIIDLDDAVKSMSGSVEVPTKVSQLENDANYITDADIAGKQDKIDDLETIRANASSALKEVPAEYVTESELQAKGYLTDHQDISGKQDKIDDLASIRENAAKGATALQAVPAEYVTETELNAKGYLTSHQDISGKAEVSDLKAHTDNGDIHVTAAQKTAWTNKQDAINDLATIRSGAALGATALQEHQDISGKAEVSALNAHTSNASIHVTTTDKSKWNAAESNAKSYADSLNTAMDTRVKALEAWQFATEEEVDAIFN